MRTTCIHWRLIAIGVVSLAVMAAIPREPEATVPSLSGLALPVSHASAPYDDFLTDDHTTLEVHHIVDACGRHPRLPCGDDSHWRLRFGTLEYDGSPARLDALTCVLTDTANRSRQKPGDRNSPSDRRMLLVVDPTAPLDELAQAIEPCARAGIWNLWFLARHPDRPAALARLGFPLPRDPQYSRLEHDAIKVFLTSDGDNQNVVRRLGSVVMAARDADDRRLHDLIRDRLNGLGEGVPVTVVAQENTSFQRVLDVITIGHDVHAWYVGCGTVGRRTHTRYGPGWSHAGAEHLARVALPLSGRGEPHADFARTDDATLEIGRISEWCALHGDQPCLDGRHWQAIYDWKRFGLFGAGLEALTHRLEDTANLARMAASDGSSTSAPRVLLVIDPTAPWAIVSQVIESCAGAGLGNLSLAVRLSAVDRTIARLDCPLPSARAGPRTTPVPLTVSLAFNPGDGGVTRRFNGSDILPDDEGDVQLQELLRGEIARLAKQGLPPAVIVDAGPQVTVQHIVDVFTIASRLKVEVLDFGFTSLQRAAASQPASQPAPPK